MFDGSPVLLMSNRDENNDRPWTGPALISRIPRVYGPRDTLAGGTWLGVNEAGLLVTITNHIGSLSKGSSFCSRGYVVAEALRHETADEARRLVELLSPECKSYTMLVADPQNAWVIDHPANAPGASYKLEPGLHAVTNSRFGVKGDVKAGRVRERMAVVAGKPFADADDAKRLLGDHGLAPGQINELCVHPGEGSRFATVSSALVDIGVRGEVRRFLFAGGPPCTANFIDCTPEF